MKGTNKIIARTYFRIGLTLKSPLNIGNGDDYYTDSDLLKREVDGKNEYFIPGTAIAGAFREYLLQPDLMKEEKQSDEKKRDCIYGFSDGERGQMSSVFFSDIVLSETGDASIRDFVSLKHAGNGTGFSEKQVDNKFDMEILEPGAKGTLNIECIQRENDKNSPVDEVKKAIRALADGEIRFGAKKTRGFGRVSVDTVWQRTFSKESLNDWLKFEDPKTADNKKYEDENTYESWLAEENTVPESRYYNISIPLKQVGGISIRKYSAIKGDPDFSHITSNGIPVIPGSSWMGAIRSDARTILKGIGLSTERTEELIDGWFGCAKSKNKVDSHVSTIIIDESQLDGGTFLPMTRNQIDRFTGGTVGTALYTEKAYFGGTTELSFHIRKDENADQSKQYSSKALVALMNLIVMDIEEGYVSVGGEASIGRGIFEKGDSAEVWQDVDLADCQAELAEVCAEKDGDQK